MGANASGGVTEGTITDFKAGEAQILSDLAVTNLTRLGVGIDGRVVFANG